MRSTLDLSGKTAFLPGGYGALGQPIAIALAACGATVIVAGRSRDRAMQFAEDLERDGYRAYGTCFDAREIREFQGIVAGLARRFGTLDILVNCLGFQREQTLLELSEEAFDQIIAINLKAAMFLAQSVAREQISSGRGGKHIHLLSIRASLGFRGRGYSAYCASKAALALMLKQHALELAPYGITVNGIAPSTVATEKNAAQLLNEEYRNRLMAAIPRNRLASKDDVADSVLFFCAMASDFVTGQILYVDGGITAGQSI
jgi:NAD(P)-dependent dehydrogenase (short-subunit alcohol dehydrogenase family)